MTQMHRIKKLINFCARVLTGKRKFEHISREVIRLRLPDPTKLLNYHQLSIVHGVLLTDEPAALSSMFEYADHNYGTRQAGRLRPSRARTNAGKRRLGHTASTQYNALPPDLIAKTSVPGFRRSLRTVLGL